MRLLTLPLYYRGEKVKEKKHENNKKDKAPGEQQYPFLHCRIHLSTLLLANVFETEIYALIGGKC
jgi:hypothetical protein